VYRTARFSAAKGSTPIITLSNGSPFLLEYHAGPGRVLLYSIAATPEWSDFPMKGLFVPLLHRSVSYLGQPSTSRTDILVGAPFSETSSRLPLTPMTIVDPENMKADLRAAFAGPERALRFTETMIPGPYTIISGRDTVDQFAVNMDPDESDSRPADAAAFSRMEARLGIDQSSFLQITAGTDPERTVLESRFGIELWRYFLLAALASAVAEMLVARDSKRQLAELTGQTR